MALRSHPLGGKSLEERTAARPITTCWRGWGTTFGAAHLCRFRERDPRLDHARHRQRRVPEHRDDQLRAGARSDYVRSRPNSAAFTLVRQRHQREGAAMLPASHRSELDGAEPSDANCSGLSFGTHGYVWGGIDGPAASRKQGYWRGSSPIRDASIPIDNGNPGVAAIAETPPTRTTSSTRIITITTTSVHILRKLDAAAERGSVHGARRSYRSLVSPCLAGLVAGVAGLSTVTSSR